MYLQRSLDVERRALCFPCSDGNPHSEIGQLRSPPARNAGFAGLGRSHSFSSSGHCIFELDHNVAERGYNTSGQSVRLQPRREMLWLCDHGTISVQSHSLVAIHTTVDVPSPSQSTSVTMVSSISPRTVELLKHFYPSWKLVNRDYGLDGRTSLGMYQRSGLTDQALSFDRPPRNSQQHTPPSYSPTTALKSRCVDM